MKSYKTLLLVAALTGMTAGTAMAQWSLSGNAGGGLIGSTNNESLRIRTNNTERARYTNAGSFGIGTTTPGRTLHIHTNPSAPQLRLSDNSDAWDIWAGYDFHIRTSGGTDWLNLDSASRSIRIGPSSELFVSINTGDVGIGTTSPNSRLTINGSITAASVFDFMGTGSFRWQDVWACHSTIQTSDARFKENIAEMEYGMDELMKLHPVSFTWKDNPANGVKLGLIAQEVKEVIPEVVREDEKSGRMGLYYLDVLPVIVKSIQEQQATLDAENAEHDALQRQIVSQERRIAELEAALGVADGK